MSQIIYKYTLSLGQNRFQLPLKCRILTAQMQNEKLVVWVQLDPEEKEQIEVDFFVIGTGHETVNGIKKATYLNTVQDSDGMVWHIFWNI